MSALARACPDLCRQRRARTGIFSQMRACACARLFCACACIQAFSNILGSMQLADWRSVHAHTYHRHAFTQAFASMRAHMRPPSARTCAHARSWSGRDTCRLRRRARPDTSRTCMRLHEQRVQLGATC
eukprot:883905-Pleurochrysis_carterae.AAC.2